MNLIWTQFLALLFVCLFVRTVGNGYCFMQNESINGHHKNVKFMCADVTSPELKVSENSVDLIFSNWLLMYLSDKEVYLLSHLFHQPT